MQHTVTLREMGGRIHWTLSITPHADDLGRYDGAKFIDVVDQVTFAGDTGCIGEPDDAKQAREQGRWLYREYGDEIDVLVRAAIERSMEIAQCPD